MKKTGKKPSSTTPANATPGFSDAERTRLEQARRLLVRGHHDVETGARIIHELFWQRLVDMYRANRQSIEDAEDLANEAIFRISDNMEALRDPEKAEAWAMIIARNLLNTHATEQKRRQQSEVVLDEEKYNELIETHVAEAEDAETAECIDRQTDRFRAEHPERYYVLIQSAVAGWGTTELMNYLSRTDTATRSYLTSCRKKFAAYVEPCLENIHFYKQKA